MWLFPFMYIYPVIYFNLMSSKHPLGPSHQSQTFSHAKISHSSAQKILMNKSKRAQSLVISCSKCTMIFGKYRKLKDLLVQIQNHKEELIDDIDLLFSNFSYILELVSENIIDKVKEYIHEQNEQKQNIEKKQHETQSKRETWCRKLITSQKRQISLLKNKLLTIQNQNQGFRTRIQPSVENSICSFNPNARAKQKKLSFNVKQNEMKEYRRMGSSVQIQQKIDSIEEMRKKLRQLKSQIANLGSHHEK